MKQNRIRIILCCISTILLFAGTGTASAYPDDNNDYARLPSEAMWEDLHRGYSYQGDYSGSNGYYRDGGGSGDDDLPPGGGSGGGGGVGTIALADWTLPHLLAIAGLYIVIKKRRKMRQEATEEPPKDDNNDF